MRELDQMAVTVVSDSQKLDEFIKQHEFFILKIASKVTKRYVQKNDDEWSVALAAFADAIKKYEYRKGSFLAFAELVIHRSLVDYYRTQARYSAEIQTDYIDDHALTVANDYNLKTEIEEISHVLQRYGFSFMDLAVCSPKAQKTKSACAKAIVFLVHRPLLIKEMRDSKQLPVKIIEKNTGVPRKIIERHRKYIIAAAEILHGDYPCLWGYLSFVREDVK